jgi:beta-galactosidase
MAAQLRFITELVKTLGKHENIVVWNTWQEISYWSEGLVGQHVCYCENTMAHFHRWLHAKYGDLDALNRAWNTRYLDWHYVQPERTQSAQFRAQEIEWRYFIDNVQIADVLKRRAEAIRAADPLHRPVFAHKGSPVIGSGQDWTYARCQDFLGSSCYPAWGSLHGWDDGNDKPLDRHKALLAEMWSNVALKYDYIRCCNPPGKPVWAAEFQGGPVSTGFHKGRVPSPEDIRRWMLTAVSSGVTAVSFWVTRAEIMAAEVNGFSLLDSVGDGTPRFAEAGRIGRALNRHADLFGQPMHPRSEVAILINEWNHQSCSVMAQGGGHLNYSVRGWYRLFWEAGIPVDFLEVSELGEKYARKYKALVLPFPLTLSESVAGKLAAYVESGGNLVSEACPGRIDEFAFCNRGELSPRMADLFGVRHGTFTMVREPNNGSRWSPAERTWGEYLEPAMLTGDGPLAGHKLQANVYVETYVPKGAQPILRHGEAVAATVKDVGRGKAWLLGTFAGHCGTTYRNEESLACLKALLALACVRPAHPGRLLLRKRVLQGKEAWLFTNPTDGPVTEKISVGGWRNVESLLGEPLERDGDSVTLRVGSLDVAVVVVSAGA